jgi:hypothetical protein
MSHDTLLSGHLLGGAIYRPQAALRRANVNCCSAHDAAATINFIAAIRLRAWVSIFEFRQRQVPQVQHKGVSDVPAVSDVADEQSGRGARSIPARQDAED